MNWKSRKFIVVLTGMIGVISLCAFGKVTGADASKVLITGIGAYCGANYLQKRIKG